MFVDFSFSILEAEAVPLASVDAATRERLGIGYQPLNVFAVARLAGQFLAALCPCRHISSTKDQSNACPNPQTGPKP